MEMGTGKTFQLTRLLRGVTTQISEAPTIPTISTHTPLARRDVKQLIDNDVSPRFQLTRLLRGVTVPVTQ